MHCNKTIPYFDKFNVKISKSGPNEYMVKPMQYVAKLEKYSAYILLPPSIWSRVFYAALSRRQRALPMCWLGATSFYRRGAAAVAIVTTAEQPR